MFPLHAIGVHGACLNKKALQWEGRTHACTLANATHEPWTLQHCNTFKRKQFHTSISHTMFLLARLYAAQQQTRPQTYCPRSTPGNVLVEPSKAENV